MQKKRVLITGIISLLGKYITETLFPYYELFGTVHNKLSDTSVPIPQDHLFYLDITQKNDVRKIVDITKPDILIHLAAQSNIDYCEQHEKEAYAVNVTSTKYICESIRDTKIHLIFASSNAVFYGDAPPYNESAKPNPGNVYGKTKWAAEKIIKKTNVPWTILRLTTLFGWSFPGTRHNDVTYYLEKLKGNEPLQLVNDRFFNPVYALRAAVAIRKIIEKKEEGIIHIAGKDRVNRYLFVKQIAQSFDVYQTALLVPVTSDVFSHLAFRPLDATLTITKMQRVLDIIPLSLKKELEMMREETSL